MTNLIFDKQVERFHLLFSLYKRSNAQTELAFNLRDLANQRGMGYHAFRSAYDFLVAEDLMQPRHYTSATDMQEGYFFASITIKGINAIERVFRNTHQDSQYFPPYSQMVG